MYEDDRALLTCRGSNSGMVLWAEGPLWVSNNAMAIMPNSGAHRYCYYNLLNNPAYDMVSGSAQPQITRTDLQKKLVAWHGEDEQHAIAITLGTLDDKIELNRRMAATLEGMARALYRSWFVDFDPVHAKVRGEAPAHMDPATAALFPDRFGEDGLPEGWRMGTLGDVIEFNPGEKLKKGTEAPYLEMKALPTSGALADPPYRRAFTSGMKFRAGDTLLARITPCLENGKAAMIDDLLGDPVGWGSTEFIVMRAAKGISPMLPYCIARDDEFRAEAIQTMTGSSGRQRADATRISEFPHCIAPEPIHRAFEEICAPMTDRIFAAGRESRTLAALRDALLPRLMSGELRITDAQMELSGETQSFEMRANTAARFSAAYT